MGRSRTVLFLGGTRFFGRLIVGHLLASGHRVTLMTRGNKPVATTHDGLNLLKGDRKDAERLAEVAAMGPFDTVIDNICYDSNDAETAMAIFAGRCERYILTSSVMSYLNTTMQGRELSESDWADSDSTEGLEQQYQPGELRYAENKRACEALVMSETGLSGIALRLQNVVGEYDFSGKSAWIAQRLMKGETIRIVGQPQDTYQQIYAGDLPAVYTALVEADRVESSAYNLAGPTMPIAEYIDVQARALGCESLVEWLPDGDGEDIRAGVPFPANVKISSALAADELDIAFRSCQNVLPGVARSVTGE